MLERELDETRTKYDLLYNQVTTQGAAAVARAAETGEEAFRMANGELMTPEKFMERTRILSQTRLSLERTESKLTTLQNENARLQKEKEAAVNECKKYENMFARFDKPHRYEMFSNEMHRKTVEENHRLVDHVDDLAKSLSEANEELLILRRRCSAIHVSTAFLSLDGSIPSICPMGGCSDYPKAGNLKNFQCHLNLVHRVVCGFVLFVCRLWSDLPEHSAGVANASSLRR
jgi:hypothetical protein